MAAAWPWSCYASGCSAARLFFGVTMSEHLLRILDSCRNGNPALMGILNVTPDSFSDGGRFLDASVAVAGAAEMIGEGAAIIDVGAESTRPGAERISAEEQIRRLRDILPAVSRIADDAGVIISIDTTRAAVAAFAVDAGAAVINDVSAGRDDDNMLSLAAEKGCGVVLMHMLGQPATMQSNPRYDDVVGAVKTFLSDRREEAIRAGVSPEQCILDPGIGFGKRLQDNLALMHSLDRFLDLGSPILVGPSRKRFIGEICSVETPVNRLGGTVAACLSCFRRGATLFRVHDIMPVRQALAVAAAIEDCA